MAYVFLMCSSFFFSKLLKMFENVDFGEGTCTGVRILMNAKYVTNLVIFCERKNCRLNIIYICRNVAGICELSFILYREFELSGCSTVMQK